MKDFESFVQTGLVVLLMMIISSTDIKAQPVTRLLEKSMALVLSDLNPIPPYGCFKELRFQVISVKSVRRAFGIWHGCSDITTSRGIWSTRQISILAGLFNVMCNVMLQSSAT